MCDIAVDDHPDASKFVPNRYKTQEMCDQAVDDYFHKNLSPIDINLWKYVIKLFLKTLFH